MDSSDVALMQRALQVARQGSGFVEPNPAVGALVVDNAGNVLAEAYHQRFGEPHAEVNAIRAAGSHCRGADLYVTLEPCCHFGKTPPCADAVIAAGFQRVIVGCTDPAEHVAGRGIQRLRDAGIHVDLGVCEAEARRLIAPFAMLQRYRRPWVIAKWAMSLDGRIATRTGSSQWISGAASRAEVHRLRGRMDAIITGAGTVRADNPTLTARPPGPRVAARIVIDVTAESVQQSTNLQKTAADVPVILFVGAHCDRSRIDELRANRIEVIIEANGNPQHVSAEFVMQELGRRQFTNVMLEGGPGLLGKFFDAALVDEVCVFVAPKVIGGATAPGPIGGCGQASVPSLESLRNTTWRQVGDDLMLTADITHNG